MHDTQPVTVDVDDPEHMTDILPAEARAELAAGRGWFSYSALSTYAACPLKYAFRYLDRVPVPERV